MSAPSLKSANARDASLVRIQNRALWLAMQMVHHANKARTVEGVKVGGHMTSSSSVVTI